MVRKTLFFLIALWLLIFCVSCNSEPSPPTATLTAVPIPTPTVEPAPTIVPTPTPSVEPTPTPAFQPDMAIFETVWQTVRDGFYDPDMNGVDWQAMHDLYKPQVSAAEDEETYYLLLNEMLFELGVSHIGLLPPGMADELDPILFPPGSLGFDVRLLEEQMVVTAVQPDSPAAAQGLQPGYVINTINGLTANELAQEGLQIPALNERHRQGMITQAVRAKLFGELGEQVTISYLNGSDQAEEVVLTYAPRLAKQTAVTPDLPPAFVEFEAYRLEPEIGYMRFSGFLIGVDEDAAAAIDEMADTRALIIDLRGNPGGVFPVRKAMVEKLVGERVLFWQYRQRDQVETVHLAAMPTAYQGNVVILIDELSASSSEEFAGGLQAIGRAMIVGNRSPGSCLTANIVPLENGAILLYPFGQSQTVDGYVLENNGVVPDVSVYLDRASLLAGRDVQLEAALATAKE
jgi:carboxyl-terminal processing protease